MTTFRPGWDAIPAPVLGFWTEYHVCTLTTLRPDGRPHVVPVGVALDLEQKCAWVITSEGSRKVAHLRAAGPHAPVAACAVDGPRWSTLEGTATVCDDEHSVARAIERYTARYRSPRPNPHRVALRLEVDRFVFGPALVGPR
ncbi:TIGR03618 family F420-dependent PPOX class oxidoreductase [Nocardioides sp. dk4132]|uniref:pyridoxamine 5'-phosphate oxidase family protein n=1 Tax=unclassified Nocardioides TaxID=2615069 RepID=UPI001294FF95|nr:MULTISPECIES: TIGR03618 family F420-dependent PPOX class oxidoreductase [unclassified Nocardioides]MQW76126.1 TIGR03618 family F420-dependent PPOX class oxidoreductase [Nocardioides sp. dk4132]QGA08969.1 TIGR03618 family F420-dependent PPOX class oxidoreductase [Nocardioides sp. dk884]